MSEPLSIYEQGQIKHPLKGSSYRTTSIIAKRLAAISLISITKLTDKKVYQIVKGRRGIVATTSQLLTFVKNLDSNVSYKVMMQRMP